MSQRTVQTFTTNDGRSIYTYSVRSFPSLETNIYIIDNHGELIMVDCGSGMPKANEDLLDGFTAVAEKMGKPITFADLDLIMLTHGHSDHFGGLPYLRQFSDAPVAIHQLDLRVISHYEQRRLVASRRLEAFAEEAGVSAKMRKKMMGMYLFAKDMYQSSPVQHLLHDKQTFHNIQVHHVPGHCPGQVCLQVDDVLLTADHILSHTTPHQAPESITLNTGLGHYMASLDKIAALEEFRIGLGGHEEPIQNIKQRIVDIKDFHESRLDKVRAICQKEPKNVQQISQELFGPREGYHVWLALEEAGAHVEYLYLRGELIAANIETIANNSHPVIEYVAV